MCRSSVAPLQGAGMGASYPRLKPGFKHGQAPTAQSHWRGLVVRNPPVAEHEPDADDSSGLPEEFS
jgi:hypothetical protein